MLTEFRTYFDGVQVQNPLNESALQNGIKRDSSLGGMLITQEGRLTFGNDGYEVLRAIFDGEDHCEEIACLIQYQCGNVAYTVIEGLIKIADVTIDRQLCQATTIITDNNFYARINNNKSVQIDIASTISKSGVTISPVPVYEINMFDPITGNYGDDVLGIRVKDLLEFQIAWMSDGEIALQSDFLDDDSVSELFISTGYDIRVPGSPDYIPYQISFDFVYSNLKRLFNLSFFIEKTTTGQTLRLEKADYFFDQTDSYTFSDIKNIRSAIKRDRIYGQVEIGSAVVRDAGWLAFTETTRLFGFNQEQYYFGGQCNEDLTLQLRSDFVYSSNVIEDTYMFISAENDSEFFLIECENVDTGALTCDAKQYQFFNSIEVYYNLGRLANNRVMENYVGFIPTSIVTFLGDKTNGFKATPINDRAWSDNGINGSTVIPSGGYLEEPFAFGDETTGDNFDGTGNYNNGTYKYTCPTADVYTFNFEIDYATAGLTAATGFNIVMVIKQYASDNVTLKNFAIRDVNNFQNGTGFTEAVSAAFICDAGDIIQTRFELTIIGSFQFNVHKIFHLKNSSYFSANIGTLVLSESKMFKNITHEFRYTIAPSDYVVIEQNPLGLYSFEKDGVTKKGYIDDLKYNWNTKEATIKLISDASTY